MFKSSRARRRNIAAPLADTLVALALLAFVLPPCSAVDVAWDGASYLPVPVKLGSDTRLVMPEAFDDAWEHDDQVSASLLDAHTLIIRPRAARVEQRLTMRGRDSGNLYLARVSSSLPYMPLVNVQVSAARSTSTGEAPADGSVTALLKAMMLGSLPAGFKAEKSSRVLLDEAPYRIVAEQVWQSARQSGVIAQLHSTLPQRAVPLVPANVQIRIAALGTLRAMAADGYVLGPDAPSTRIYLVYGR
jgi:hypothetical protein